MRYIYIYAEEARDFDHRFSIQQFVYVVSYSPVSVLSDSSV